MTGGTPISGNHQFSQMPILHDDSGKLDLGKPSGNSCGIWHRSVWILLQNQMGKWEKEISQKLQAMMNKLFHLAIWNPKQKQRPLYHEKDSCCGHRLISGWNEQLRLLARPTGDHHLQKPREGWLKWSQKVSAGETCKQPTSSGWWLGHPSEKYEFVNWDD